MKHDYGDRDIATAPVALDYCIAAAHWLCSPGSHPLDSGLSGFKGSSNSPDRIEINLSLHMKTCNNLHMATNLALDDKLIEEARRAGHHKTKRDAVTAALAEYVRRRKQQRILDAFGTFEFDPAYNYKAERRRRRP